MSMNVITDIAQSIVLLVLLAQTWSLHKSLLNLEQRSGDEQG